MNISHLKYPPIKFKKFDKIPERLISKGQANYFGTKCDQFIMFSTEKGSNDHAIMRCFPELISRDGKNNVPSLYVWFISSNCSGKGFGSEMLDFARHYSKKIGCLGNLHLTSDVAFTPHRIPHIFYRKFGMSTKSAAIDKKLDKFIEAGKIATYKDFDNVDMYYPPIEHMKDRVDNFIFKGFRFIFNSIFGLKD